MLHNCYETMKSGMVSQKGQASSEIHILKALVASSKSKIPEHLQYRDEWHMYFLREELLPFLKEVDIAVKRIVNKVFKSMAEDL